jgi:hypothetical protein
MGHKKLMLFGHFLQPQVIANRGKPFFPNQPCPRYHAFRWSSWCLFIGRDAMYSVDPFHFRVNLGRDSPSATHVCAPCSLSITEFAGTVPSRLVGARESMRTLIFTSTALIPSVLPLFLALVSPLCRVKSIIYWVAVLESCW